MSVGCSEDQECDVTLAFDYMANLHMVDVLLKIAGAVRTRYHHHQFSIG